LKIFRDGDFVPMCDIPSTCPASRREAGLVSFVFKAREGLFPKVMHFDAI
jgi:hypothetical protein